MALSNDPAKRAAQLANLRLPHADPPAPPQGNVRALVHGARARVATLLTAGLWVEKIYTELAAEAPLRDSDGELPIHDRQAVELCASACARLQSVQGWLETRPGCDENGCPWPAEREARHLRLEIGRWLDSLGMTPKSRAALGLDLVRTAASAEEVAVARAARARVDDRIDSLAVDVEAVPDV